METETQSILLRNIPLAEKPTLFPEPTPSPNLQPYPMTSPLLLSHILDSPILKLTSLSSQEVLLEESEYPGGKGQKKATFIPRTGAGQKGECGPLSEKPHGGPTQS